MTKQTYFRHLTDIDPTPVIQELVTLASRHTKLGAFYRLGGQTYDEMDWCDRAEAYEAGYRPDPTIGAIFCTEAPDTDMTPFWNELDRLQKLITKPLQEPILDDDYPMTGGFIYVVDGQPTMNPWMQHPVHDRRMTVLEYKQREGVSEIRECDMFGRDARLPLRPQKPVVKTGWNEAGNHMHQRKRKPRSSNKIKKVQ